MSLARALVRCLAVLPLLFVGCHESEAPVPIGFAIGSTTLMPIGGGNALTLPAQRHLVRIGGTMLFALQQDGASGQMLGMFRSDDDGASFRRIGAIQDDASHRDTADLVVVGQDIALVYSYEGPDLFGSTAHDVYFQWWRARNGTWTPAPAVRVFDSSSGATGYSRGELFFHSLGPLGVQIFLLNRDGTSTAA